MGRRISVILSSFLSGGLIGIGVIVYCAMMSISKFAGAFLFGLGLFSIIIFGLWLYTGKIGFVSENTNLSYAFNLFLCVIFNFLGVAAVTGLYKLTRMGDSVISNASNIVALKENDSWWSILILSFFCGIMIYIAVKGYKSTDNNVGKIFIVFLPVMVFILSGFEHCVANVGYYVLAGTFSSRTIPYILLMIVGNSIGSIVFDGLLKLTNRLMK